MIFDLKKNKQKKLKDDSLLISIHCITIKAIIKMGTNTISLVDLEKTIQNTKKDETLCKQNYY